MPIDARVDNNTGRIYQLAKLYRDVCVFSLFGLTASDLFFRAGKGDSSSYLHRLENHDIQGFCSSGLFNLLGPF